MKKIIVIMMLFMLIAGAVFGANLKNGVYFAQEDEFGETGWKDNVTFVVKNGKITDVSWNSANVDAGTSKDVRSRAGQYKMVEFGAAIAPWWKQAEAVEKKLLATQDISSIRIIDADGNTDSVSGATIHVSSFVSLVKKALAEGPVGYGPYKDGVYKAEQDAFDHDYKYFVEVTVISGYIAAVNWDAYAEDGSKNKAQKSIDGEYNMVEYGGAIAPWWEQARVVEEKVLMSQSIRQPDAISGASIGLEPVYTLLNKALSGAKR